MILKFLSAFILCIFSASFAFSEEVNAFSASALSYLQTQYPDARIAWNGAPVGAANESIASVYEIRPGILRSTIATPGLPNRMVDYRFRAFRNTWIAKRRIRPGEALQREDFMAEEVDLTEPLIHEVKGLIVPAATDLEKYESRVTILEGQFPITSGVQKIPAVKRGEVVRINLRSGDLEVNVPGIVQEPAQIGGTLRVLTSSTKREVSGVLREGKIVEVAL